jgi:predicted dehydrogenase
MSKPIQIALVGLDTSHSVEFARLIQGNAPAELRIPGMHVRSCLRFPSPFHSEEGQNKRQAELESWGVQVTHDFDRALEGADAVFLEINDPSLHLEYFEKVASLGKPVFLDKPMAGNLADARSIARIARENGTLFFSSSSLRFLQSLQTLISEIPAADRKIVNVFGPLGIAAAGSSVVWYGVHTVEMLVALLGIGAGSVTAHRDPTGVTAVVEYADQRRAVVELTTKLFQYGGRVVMPQAIRTFDIGKEVLYHNLLVKIADFLKTGQSPVPVQETLEVQAILGAIEQSLETGATASIEL